jgi:hypothetical protein
MSVPDFSSYTENVSFILDSIVCTLLDYTFLLETRLLVKQPYKKKMLRCANLGHGSL